MKKIYTTHSAEETEGLARRIGANLRGGECFEFVSDLGGGKTTFVRGLAQGAGSEDAVSSPTFTISKQYRASGKTLHHFDFYRLQDPGLVQEELAEVVEDPTAVILVEWAETVRQVLPENRVQIDIKKVAENAEHRELQVDIPEPLAYLIEGVSA